MRPKGDLLLRAVHGGFLVHGLLLYGATVAILLLVLPVAWVISGMEGVAAATAGGLLCFSGGLVAMAWNAAFPGPKLLIVRTLGGMLPRMGIPLLGGVVLQIAVEPLAEAGILLYLVVFYPALLSIEVYLSVMSVRVALRDSEPSGPSEPSEHV
ncbi:MAG: hypothetical protein PHO07_01985 [Pirellulales bacterium]|nr:hypothetical protein [Thermoguttaceae bacterium]MDD4785916.1 hypothetical protein [Pirellulales bacterium]MDI9445781.1 hypothetical protein [Planctomycetota bacterium]NLZ00986.1 hypothetical protein [Pirellulaceae bacterium]